MSETKEKSSADCCSCRGARWGDLGMHGVRRLVRARGSCAKSAFWVIIIVASLAMVAYQTSLYVFRFMSYPISVSYRLDDMAFQDGGRPAVTICNLNTIKLSVLHSKHWLDNVEDLYVRSDPVKRADDISSREIFTEAGHKVKDMLVKCSFGGGSCSENNFSSTLTERGLCHTFPNLGRGRLELMVNLESYEYPGFVTDRVGLVVLVYDSSGRPAFSSHYVMVPPGTHTDIELRATSMTRLEAPFGDCNRDESTSSCQVWCVRTRVLRKCGCVPFWAATDNRNATRTLATGHSPFSQCDCKPSCDSTTYVTHSSHLKLDTSDVTRYLTETQRQDVQDTIATVANVRHRWKLSSPGNSHAEFSELTRVLDDLRYQIETLKRNIHQVRHNIFTTVDKLQKRTWFHFHIGLNGLQRTLKHGFLPLWDVVEHQFLRSLIENCRLAMFHYDSVVKKLDLMSPSDNMRRTLYVTMEEDLSARMELSIQGLDNFTKVYYSFLDKQPLTSYILTPGRRYDDTLLPVQAIEDIDDNLREEYGIISDHLARYMEHILGLRNILKEVYLSNIRLNHSEYHNTKDMISHRNLELQTHLDLFKGKVVNKLHDVLERQSEQFKKINESYFNTAGKLSAALLEQAEFLDLVSLHNYPQLVEFAQDAQLYISNPAKSMSDLTDTGLSNAVLDNLEALQSNMNQFRELGASTDSIWQKFTDQCLGVWSTMLNNPNLKAFYAKLNTDVNSMIQNPASADGIRDVFAHNKLLGKTPDEISDIDPDDFYILLNADFPVTSDHSKSVEVRETTAQYRRLTDVHLQLQNLDKAVVRAYQSLRAILEEFRENSKLQNSFVSENLVGISVRMASEGHELLEETVAYPPTELLRDVGIVMAVFLGASLISFIELLDIFCSCICCGRHHRDTAPPDGGPDAASPPSSPRHVTFQFPDTGNHVTTPTRPALKRPKPDPLHSDYYIPSDMRERLPSFDETQMEML